MFLRSIIRRKDGKDHRYWSVVENRRVGRRRVVQKTLLYLGEINDAQQAGWVRAMELVDGKRSRQLALFPADREPPAGCAALQVRMDALELLRPRQWGGCWLALALWAQLRLDDFWRTRLPPSREGTDWLGVLKTLTVYRLLASGGCIAIGSTAPPWPISWVRISGWRPRMRCTVAWTGCWNINGRSSII